MIALTKTYRLVWQANSGMILNDYQDPQPWGSITYVSGAGGYYESDVLADLVEEISKKVLWEKPKKDNEPGTE